MRDFRSLYNFPELTVEELQESNVKLKNNNSDLGFLVVGLLVISAITLIHLHFNENRGYRNKREEESQNFG